MIRDYVTGVRDAVAKVREVGDQMDAESAARREAGGPWTEDARYRELNGRMEQAISDRRDAVLGRGGER